MLYGMDGNCFGLNLYISIMTTDFRQMMEDRHANTKGLVQDFCRPEYIFHENFQRQIQCNSVTAASGRYYTTPNGNRYPSITTVLSKSNEQKDIDSLNRWKQRVGVEEAAKITKAAAGRGTSLHTLVEQFIKSDGYNTITLENNKNAKLFKQIHPFLGRIGEIHIIEKALYSDILKVAGRVDLIGEFDGKLSVIDFKTSTKVKEEHWITDYLLQETFYSVAFGAIFPERIEQIVTIMTVEEGNTPQLFIKKPGDYIEELVLRVKKYYVEN